ncbi:MAG: hypothetical protein AMXMBFR7_24520 [Planctomycetota bacterium]
MSDLPPPAPTHPAPPRAPTPARPPASSGGGNVLKWVLIGCGGITVLGILMVVGLSLFVWNKAKEAGYDHDLMKRNPELAAAKIAVVSNPDVDLVSIDENKRTLTVKDKKSGKVTTLNLQQVMEGSWSFETVDAEGNAEHVEFKATPGGAEDPGKLQVTTQEGVMTYGGKTVETPAWLPLYPGAKAQSLMSNATADRVQGMFSQQTPDSAEQVAAFYKEKLEASGFKLKQSTFQQDQKTVISLQTEKDAANRSVILSIMQETGKPTTASIQFNALK